MIGLLESVDVEKGLSVLYYLSVNEEDSQNKMKYSQRSKPLIN